MRLTEFRYQKQREIKLARQQQAKLEDMFANMGKGEQAALNIVLKADVQGSVEALRDSLSSIDAAEISVKIVFVLTPMGRWPGVELAEQVISRIKVMANSTSPSAACRRTAASRCRSRGREIDLRVSIMPSIFGEDAVLRILDKQSLSDELHGLHARRPRLRRATPWRGMRKLRQRALRHAAGHRADRQRQDHHAVRARSPRSTTAATRSSPSRTRSNTSCPACCRSRSTRRRG